MEREVSLTYGVSRLWPDLRTKTELCVSQWASLGQLLPLFPSRETGVVYVQFTEEETEARDVM